MQIDIRPDAASAILQDWDRVRNRDGTVDLDMFMDKLRATRTEATFAAW